MQLSLLAAFVLLLYFAGRFLKPVGELYAFVFTLIRMPFASLEKRLGVFQSEPDTEKPGLATIVSLLAFVVALFATTAEVYSGVDAAGSLFGDVGGETLFLPGGLAALALGTLFLSISIIWGMIWLECKEYVPQQARLLALSAQKAQALQRLSFWSLVLIEVASVLAYLERESFTS